MIQETAPFRRVDNVDVAFAMAVAKMLNALVAPKHTMAIRRAYSTRSCPRSFLSAQTKHLVFRNVSSRNKFCNPDPFRRLGQIGNLITEAD